MIRCGLDPVTSPVINTPPSPGLSLLSCRYRQCTRTPTGPPAYNGCAEGCTMANKHTPGRSVLSAHVQRGEPAVTTRQIIHYGERKVTEGWGVLHAASSSSSPADSPSPPASLCHLQPSPRRRDPSACLPPAPRTRAPPGPGARFLPNGGVSAVLRLRSLLSCDYNQTWARTDAAPLSSFVLAEEEAPGSADRHRPAEPRVMWTPAAAGKPPLFDFLRHDLLFPPSPQLTQTTRGSHMERGCFGAAEGQRRGSAFKGPDAWCRLQLAVVDVSDDFPEAEAIHQEITSRHSLWHRDACATEQ